MYTDGFCVYGIYKTANYWLKHGVTVYQYVLSYEGSNSFTNIEYGIESIGVAHGDDLFYMFNYEDYKLNKTDQIIREIVVDAWTNFAIFGDPTPPGSEYNWKPLTNVEYFEYFNISGSNSKMDHSEYLQERMKTWQNIIG